MDSAFQDTVTLVAPFAVAVTPIGALGRDSYVVFACVTSLALLSPRELCAVTHTLYDVSGDNPVTVYEVLAVVWRVALLGDEPVE